MDARADELAVPRGGDEHEGVGEGEGEGGRAVPAAPVQAGDGEKTKVLVRHHHGPAVRHGHRAGEECEDALALAVRRAGVRAGVHGGGQRSAGVFVRTMEDS